MKALLPFLIVLSLTAVACQKKHVAPAPPQPEPQTQPAEQAPSPAPAHDHEMHEGHKEVKVPTPLAQLQEVPLDVAPACKGSACSVLLLYNDRLDVLDWQNGQTRSIAFPPTFQSTIRSRAPSGKIVKFGDGYLVLNNNLANPVYFNTNLDPTPGIYTNRPEWLPIPEPGRNWFSLNDGHFYDFDLLSEKGIAAVDIDYRLNLADGGKLLTSAERVGATLSVFGASIYTSSPTLPNQPDTILKFDRTSLQQVSSRATDGQIADLCVTDLNGDGENELLVTVISMRGIFIQVLEPF
jgi:hypothetical protein